MRIAARLCSASSACRRRRSRRRERLEQLRALEAGMRIDAIVVDDVPFGSIPEQLAEARDILRSRSRP